MSTGKRMSLSFQSAPLREGRPIMHHRQQDLRTVSIRAPARGATSKSSSTGNTATSFNPRPCARGDVPQLGGDNSDTRVSIRAPARGATARASSAAED